MSPESRNGPSPRFDQATFVTSVNAGSFSATTRRSDVFAAQVSRFGNRGPGGAHELELGIEHEWTRRTSSVEYPGGALYLDREGVPEYVRLWDGERTRPRYHRTSVYVQDTWRALDHLTFEPGLRIGVYRSALPDVTMRLYENRSIAPRLGLAWDVARDHRTVVRGHYGHYHDAMATGFYQHFDPLAQSPSITARVLDDGTFEEVTRSGGSIARQSIDPDLKHSYAEEFLAAVEREVWPRFSVKAQYVRRNTRNGIGFIDTGSTWTPVEVTEPGRDGRLGTADDGPQMTVYFNHAPSAANFIMTNPQGAWRHYDALQFVGTRRYAGRWSLEASYTWAHTRGSFDNEHASNGASSDMATNGHFANPNRALFTTGRTVYDRRHDLKVFGTYTVPYFGGLRVGGVYRFASGYPYGRVVNSFGPLTGGLPILVEPVGTYELPALNSLDVRLEKTFRTAGGARVGIFGDVYNVNNQGVAERVNNASGPNFGVPRRWMAPRKLRGGVRMVW